MEKYHDIEVKFETRGDDIERLNEAIALVPWENHLLASYLCYLKFEIIENLDQAGIEFSKQEYPLGHPKGFTDEEFDEYLKGEES